MYIKRNIVARWHNSFCYGNATARSFCIVDLHVAVNSTKSFSYAMETQQCVPSALLSSYKIFRTVVKNINLLRSPGLKPDIDARF